MLPPQTRTAVRSPLERGLLLQQSRQGHGSGPFGQGLLPFEQDHDGVGDLLFIDGDNLVDIAFHLGQGEISGAPDRDSVGNRRFCRHGDRPSMLDRAQHGGKALGLHSNNTYSRVALFQGAGHAADQPPATDGYDYCLQAMNLLEQFETDGPLTVDHRIVIERVQKRHAFQLAEPERFVTGLIVVCTVQDHIGSKSTGRRDLHQGGHERHDNSRQDTTLGGVVGHGLGVIARAGGDHAAPLLVIAQQENPVKRAALFEGPGSLQIIQLEKDLLTGHLGESGRELAGGKIDEIADSLFCLLYFNEGNVHIWIKAFLLVA